MSRHSPPEDQEPEDDDAGISGFTAGEGKGEGVYFKINFLKFIPWIKRQWKKLKGNKNE